MSNDAAKAATARLTEQARIRFNTSYVKVEHHDDIGFYIPLCVMYGLPPINSILLAMPLGRTEYEASEELEVIDNLTQEERQ